MKVTTYQSPNHARMNICIACEERLTAAGKWPRDSKGEKYAQVHERLHASAYCDVEDHARPGRPSMGNALAKGRVDSELLERAVAIAGSQAAAVRRGLELLVAGAEE